MAPPVRRDELPPRANLAQQKTRARELLQAFQRHEPDAVSRVRAVLPDKPRIVLADTQFVLSREYGFANWLALKEHLDARADAMRAPHEQLHNAMMRGDAATARELLTRHAQFRPMINAPLFAFNAPALVACADNADMVDVLLDFGADPNLRSNWWAGGFHPLHCATGLAAQRLIAAGAIPDACAAAHLDDAPLLASILAATPSRVHERGGDGQTPLHFARSRSVVDLLLDAGADIDARDVDHRATPAEWMLDRARNAGRWELAQHLVERGAACDIFLAAALGRTQDAVTMLNTDASLLDAQTGRGPYGEQPPSSYHIYFWTIGSHRSPLDVAAQFGNPETLAAMLPFASPVQRLWLACRRADTAAALQITAQYPDLIASLPRDAQRAVSDAAWNGEAASVALMLDLGFDPATPGHDTGTALHCAAWQGSAATVAAVLRHHAASALINARDAHHGSTPLGWCCHGSLHGPRDGEHASVARLLLAAGATLGQFEASDEVESVVAEWMPPSEQDA